MKIIIFICIYCISSTVEHVTNEECRKLRCFPYHDAKQVCVNLTREGGPITYKAMDECQVKALECNMYVVGDAQLVNMSECSELNVSKPSTFRRSGSIYSKNQIMHNNLKLVRRSDSIDVNEDDVTMLSKELKGYTGECPKECPPQVDMVCARCNHRVYRSFLSDCELKMYQCQHPGEKIELVSRRSCYAVAPYALSRKQKPQELRAYLDASQDQNSVEPNYADLPPSVLKKLRHVGRVVTDWIPHEINRWVTPKPTVNVTWPHRHIRHHTRSKLYHTRSNTHRTSVKTTKSSPKTFEDRPTRSAPRTPKTDPVTHDSDDDISDDKTMRPDEPTTMKDIVTVDDDTCEGDEDQETTIAIPDKCDKSDRNILATQRYMKVDLDPDDIEEGAPIFTVWNRGSKITSQIRGDVGLMVGCTAYAGVDFSGDVMVKSDRDDDYLGFVFGYQNNKQFYLVTWKSKDSKFWIGKPSVVVGEAGVNVKKVDSVTGPSPDLRNALYSTRSIKDQVTLLWQDKDKNGWEHKKSYHFRLQHRPQKGFIHILITTNNSVVVNSEYIYDFTFKGGRVGVYSFSQENIEWTNLQSKCNDTISESLENE